MAPLGLVIEIPQNMLVRHEPFFIVLMLLILIGCKNDKAKKTNDNLSTTEKLADDPNEKEEITNEPPDGMVWIPGGNFYQGAKSSDKLAMGHEKPGHLVVVDGFYMDITEVTNGQFAKFVKATNYVTVAERKIDWEEMKKELPPGTPKPADFILQPGSLIFKTPEKKVTNLMDFSQWWEWKIGANWQHPYGPESSIEGKENHPVVHISYEDALAYCKWANRRLPTEAEWEYAAKGGASDAQYPWQNSKEALYKNANTWDGTFPMTNTSADGFTKTAPVRSYPANAFGLYDMAGNVWEFTQDWYNTNYYKELALKSAIIRNPQGAKEPYNTYHPYAKEKVIKGGSFLCNDNYCASYRVSARMGNSLDSAQEHVGFRTVKSLN